MAKYKRKKKKVPLSPEQERNAKIFRLRGFYANAKTLPFRQSELDSILCCIDMALVRLKAQPHSEYLGLVNPKY